ncbi:MAG: branched-chain amino acid ABC transporter ATP-binding protein/permease [Burkholderiaceae bacterium]|nr:MAG: branched-chain amino acid ABC transporter ATP-binding protein/permease [Burkholderiaceae bacterium]TAM05295.1 MAG: branched-chain amino acid ABC transporter ATP-binding protein/permease [Pusillimonas sp.]
MKKSLLLVAVLALALGTIPYLGLPPFYLSVLYLVFHWVALATSWNILSGYSGYFSFGHGAFFGIGMYTTAVLTSQFDVPFLWTLPAAAGMAALFGIVLGVVSFRVKAVRGELFALLTLAATFVVATIVLNTPIDGGPGVYLSAVPVPQIGPSASATFFYLALAAAVLTVAVAVVVFYARFGTGLFAIHDDEDVAEVMGVPTFWYKVVAFALSCALAGVVGGVHALFVSYVTTGDIFTVLLPITVILMSVLGGTRHWAGPAVGATIITILLYSFTSGDSVVLGKVSMGVILIAVILFMPEGVLGQLLKKFMPRPVVAQARKAAAEQDAQTPAAPVAPGPLAATSQVLLSARGVSKAFQGVQALHEVDLDVMRGEILGLLGPNGSGKSTFINVVSGHFPLTSGSMTFAGKKISGIGAHRIAGCGIARTYQIPRPFAHLTVLENVALPAMFGARQRERQRAERDAWHWLEFTGLADRAFVLPEDLNLHQRKFLEFARALAAHPQLLMLDEVLSGLTPSEIDEAVALIQRIRAQGTTIVFVEHVMRAVMALCDRVVVFNQGEVLAQGLPAEVMSRPDVVATYLGKPANGTPPSASGAPAYA